MTEPNNQTSSTPVTSEEDIKASNESMTEQAKDTVTAAALGQPQETGLMSSTPADARTVYATIEKTWTSGGVGGTGALSAMICARYLAKKNLKTELIDLVGTTFELSFTDIDNETTSTIPAYAFKFTDPTQIPQPSDGADFALSGTVRVSNQSSGRVLFVDFDMSGNALPGAGSTPKSIGIIFALDIPKDAKFTPQSTTPTV